MYANKNFCPVTFNYYRLRHDQDNHLYADVNYGKFGEDAYYQSEQDFIDMLDEYLDENDYEFPESFYQHVNIEMTRK